MKSRASIKSHPLHPMLIVYPFAFLTGYGGGALSAEHRGRPVLAKPIDDRELAATLARLLAPKGSPAG